MCSPKPRDTYDVDRCPLGARVRHLGQGKDPSYSEFIYMG